VVCIYIICWRAFGLGFAFKRNLQTAKNCMTCSVGIVLSPKDSFEELIRVAT